MPVVTPPPKLSSVDVASQALLREAGLSGKKLGAPAAEVTTAADNLLTAINEAKSAKEAAKMGKKLALGQETADNLHEQIGYDPNVKRDSKTGRKEHTARSPEADRDKRLGRVIKMLRTYFEKGYDGKSADPEHAALRGHVEAILELHPQLGSLLKDPADVKAFAEWLLTSEDALKADAFERFEALKNSTIEDNIQTLQTQQKAKEIEHTRLKKARNDAQTDHTTVEAQSNEFKDQTKSKGELLKNATDKYAQREQEFHDAEAEVSKLEKRLERYQRELEATLQHGEKAPIRTTADIDKDILTTDSIKTALETKVSSGEKLSSTEEADLNAAIQKIKDLAIERSISQRYGASAGRRPQSEIEKDIGQTESELKTARTTKIDKENKFKEKERLEAEKADLEEKRKKAKKDLDDAVAAFDTCDVEFQDLTQQLETAKITRAAKEEDFIKSFENIIDDAVIEWLNTKYEEMDTAYGQQETTRIAEEKDADIKKVRKLLHTKLTKQKSVKRGILGRRKTVMEDVTDPAESSKYFNILFRDGPEGVVEAFGLEPTPELMEKVGNEVVQTVLYRQISGNGISPAQIESISLTSWGNEMVDKALDKNTEVRNLVEKALGQGVLNREGGLARFWMEIRKHPLWLLLILLGAAALPIAGLGLAGAGVGAGAVSVIESVGYGVAASQMHPADENRM